ncbi:MAG: hypothetical protein FIB08_16085 [Candidatus Methanoperedens sp.]|nr:hypothetical protein [Candidatus Methanoperedens sp.]
MKIGIDKDYAKFFIIFGIVTILTPFLMDIIVRSWTTDLMKYLADGIKSFDPSGISILFSIVIGFYVGSIFLLYLDRYKRVQAILLSIGLFSITGYISKLFSINFNLIFIILGTLIGAISGNSFKLTYKKEIKQAAANISIISVIYVVISYIIFYLSTADSNNFIKDSIVVLIFSYFFGEVMSYKAKGSKIFVLGPAKSGKTLFIAGCYMRALEIAKGPIKPSPDLLELIDQMHKEEITWPRRTQVISKYQFIYEVGTLFPKEMTLRTLDYPGPFIEKIYEYMYIKRPRKKNENDKKYEEETKYEMVAKEITKSDKLIFIVDGSKYPNFADMGITQYVKILGKLHENGRNVKPYVVVTKSDFFIREYPNYENDYKGFKEFVGSRISNSIFIKELLNEASASIYPVFYYTKKVGEEGTENYIPLRDENKNMYTYGFDKFMDDLIEQNTSMV